MSDVDARSAKLFLDEKSRALYCGDVYFREAWAMATELWGDPVERLWPLAALVLKPDGVVSRAGPKVLAILRDEGFVPIAVERFRFDRHIMRASWRFHVPVPDLDRLRIVDRLMTATESLFILARDTAPEDLPATIRLTKLKGGATSERRDARQLRERLGVQHPLMTLVHAADEPADLVRDLGVYFAPEQRRDLLEQINHGNPAESTAGAILKDLHRRQPPHDLNFERSIVRIERQILATAPSPDRTRAMTLLEAMGERRSFDWQRLESLAQAVGARLDAWDLITVGAVLTAALVPPEPRTIPQDKINAWETARAAPHASP
jgi:Nucleoside diphosphate kinase